MLATVTAFPSEQKGRSQFPTPFYYQVGDEYARVDVANHDCLHVGLYPGAVLIFLKGFRQDGALHLLSPDGRPAVRRVSYSGQLVRLGPDTEHPEWMRADELDIYGALAELYPMGLKGPRSIIHREDRARLLLPANTEQGMEYRLLNAAAI